MARPRPFANAILYLPAFIHRRMRPMRHAARSERAAAQGV
jgi:hypothetical protein